jgi:hypothetical protein
MRDIGGLMSFGINEWGTAPSNSLIFLQNFDGKLTREEFKQGSKNDPWIVQALTMDMGGGEEAASQKA